MHGSQRLNDAGQKDQSLRAEQGVSLQVSSSPMRQTQAAISWPNDSRGDAVGLLSIVRRSVPHRVVASTAGKEHRGGQVSGPGRVSTTRSWGTERRAA